MRAHNCCRRNASLAPRVSLHNSTMVVANSELDEYLFRATLFLVQPHGFAKQLAHLASFITAWHVAWVEQNSVVHTSELATSVLHFLGVNMTETPQVAARLPLPARPARLTALTAAGPTVQYQVTHVDEVGIVTEDLIAPADDAPSIRDLVILTTNITFTNGAAGDGHQPNSSSASASGGATSHSPGDLDERVRALLATNLARMPKEQHAVMGIVTPPVVLDLSYAPALLPLPASMPAGYLTLVNLVAIHLPQGPRASQPDATVLLPDVWTHLLWSLPRCGRHGKAAAARCWELGVAPRVLLCACTHSRPSHKVLPPRHMLTAARSCCAGAPALLRFPRAAHRTTLNVVMLSNVTLWVPAAEFSFIRFHTTEEQVNFTINLQGGGPSDARLQTGCAAPGLCAPSARCSRHEDAGNKIHRAGGCGCLIACLTLCPRAVLCCAVLCCARARR
jgi:hypothetical protein